jgi:hypothetical protein
VAESEAERELLAGTIWDTFPPEVLYHPDVVPGPTTLYHVIIGVPLLLSRPFNQVRITGISVRIPLGVAKKMYENEDAELVLTMAESFFRNSSDRSQSTGQNQGAGVYNITESLENVAHRLGQR